MNTTKAQRKEIALKAMKKLGIYKPYIDGFKQEDKVCFFERFGGYWLYQEPEIEAKMKELEKKYNCTVFSGKPIENVIWDIFPIKTLFEYKWRWRGCPF